MVTRTKSPNLQACAVGIAFVIAGLSLIVFGPEFTGRADLYGAWCSASVSNAKLESWGSFGSEVFLTVHHCAPCYLGAGFMAFGLFLVGPMRRLNEA
jgi:hypothetical protein